METVLDGWKFEVLSNFPKYFRKDLLTFHAVIQMRPGESGGGGFLRCTVGNINKRGKMASGDIKVSPSKLSCGGGRKRC